jgi:hypothetical protein
MALLSAQATTINVPPIITIVNTTLDIARIQKAIKVLRAHS